MSDKAVDGGGKEDPAYPGESPTDAEFDEWLKRLQNVLRGTDYAALMANETPASLIGVAASVDTSDLFEQMPVADETASDKRARLIFNHKVKTAKRDEQARKDSYEAGLKKLKNGLAGRLAAMMTTGHRSGAEPLSWSQHRGAAGWLRQGVVGGVYAADGGQVLAEAIERIPDLPHAERQRFGRGV